MNVIEDQLETCVQELPEQAPKPPKPKKEPKQPKKPKKMQEVPKDDQPLIRSNMKHILQYHDIDLSEGKFYYYVQAVYHINYDRLFKIIQPKIVILNGLQRIILDIPEIITNIEICLKPYDQPNE
jgi:hypothetical protein